MAIMAAVPVMWRKHFHHGVPMNFDVWDTAGQERFSMMPPMFYRKASIVVVCFDITDQKSFDGARKWMEKAKTCTWDVNEPFYIVLGCKSDLEEKRVISRVVAEEYAASENAKYYECSAKDGVGVMEPLLDAAQAISDKLDRGEWNLGDHSLSAMVHAASGGGFGCFGTDSC